MEDLRDAEHIVASFAVLIQNLRPKKDPPQHKGEDSALLSRRQGSNSSEKSAKSSISSRWLHKKKEWDETMEGALWNELEKPQSDVAQKFQVDQTALKEYISSPEMMHIGCEFVQHYHGESAGENAFWVAEDLFFDLQAVKQGDAEATRWAAPKAPKKTWDLADHLARFVVLSEQCRLNSGQEKWMAWEWSFATKVGFYLSVLRCYTIRDAKQRQLAKGLRGSPRSSRGSMSSRHGLSP